LRLRRASGSGNAAPALAAAAELPRVPLDGALALLVLLRDDERRFGRAVVRWHARFCLEVTDLGPSEAHLALPALRSQSAPDVAVGAALRYNEHRYKPDKITCVGNA
jgi:hypothetical protein